MSQAVVDALVNHGFTRPQAEGLHSAWQNPEMQHLLGEVAYAVHDAGGTAADAIDYIKHGLKDNTAGVYQHHGFTAHQAHLIEHHEQARQNLYADGDLRALGILESPTPRDYITLALTVAHSHDEATDLIQRYQVALAGTPRVVDDGPDTIADLEAALAARRPSPSVHRCDCTFDTV